MTRHLIIYADGEHAKKGDRILIDNGEREGHVTVLIDDETQMEQWGLTELGLMIRSDLYGLLFIGESEIVPFDVRLVSRESD